MAERSLMARMSRELPDAFVSIYAYIAIESDEILNREQAYRIGSPLHGTSFPHS